MAESLTEIAVRKLTSLIMSGEIEPDTHLQEAHVAELLGMSRTPVRTALAELANGGLLVPGPWRGYKVRTFTLQEVGNAYAVRATLEGMVCRILAEDGVAEDKMKVLKRILQDGDIILNSKVFDREALKGWMQINRTFHATLASTCNNEMLVRMIEISQSIPLVHAGFVGRYQYGKSFINHLLQAQSEHYRLLRAIEHRHSTRADALMQQHIIDAAETWLASIGSNVDSTSRDHGLELGKLSEEPLDLRGLKRRGDDNKTREENEATELL